MANPTEAELLKSVYTETHQAASLVSHAWVAGQFTPEQASEMVRHLQCAVAAMLTLESRLRGVPPPKIGG